MDETGFRHGLSATVDRVEREALKHLKELRGDLAEVARVYEAGSIARLAVAFIGNGYDESGIQRAIEGYEQILEAMEKQT